MSDSSALSLESGELRPSSPETTITISSSSSSCEGMLVMHMEIYNEVHLFHFTVNESCRILPPFLTVTLCYSV